MSNPSKEHVKSYYDERVEGKLSDFTDFNPRIEAAVRSLAEWAPPEPKRILEIGCGIGATSWRMARAWPDAEVIGADLSPLSIDVAKACFKLPNLSYFQGLIEPGAVAGRFDLVVLMDVYEHIAVDDRPVLHKTIAELLSDDSRVFFSVPTPAHLGFLKQHHPLEIQPVDEDVGPADVLAIAADTNCKMLFFREVSIWSQGDYAHFTIGRYRSMERVEASLPRTGISLRGRLRSLIYQENTNISDPWNYLGPSVHGQQSRSRATKFAVSPQRRKELSDKWLRKNPD
jgi:SAM-dependent methyltransferase